MTTIFRCPHDKENPYLLISRDFLRNPELSLEAKGLLCYFLSFKETYEFHTENIWRELKISETQFYRIFNELRKNGFVLRIDSLSPNPKGGFLTKTSYCFTEESKTDYSNEYLRQEKEREEKNKKKALDLLQNSNNFTATPVSGVSVSGVSEPGELKKEQSKKEQSKKEQDKTPLPPVGAVLPAFKESEKREEGFGRKEIPSIDSMTHKVGSESEKKEMLKILDDFGIDDGTRREVLRQSDKETIVRTYDLKTLQEAVRLVEHVHEYGEPIKSYCAILKHFLSKREGLTEDDAKNVDYVISEKMQYDLSVRFSQGFVCDNRSQKDIRFKGVPFDIFHKQFYDAFVAPIVAPRWPNKEEESYAG